MTDPLWILYDKFGPDYARIVDDLAREYGIIMSRSAVRHKIKKGRPQNLSHERSESVESEPGVPISLEELLAKHAVDTDTYEVDRYTVNEWNNIYQTKAHLVRKPSASLEILKAQLVEDIRADTALRPRMKAKPFESPVDSETHALEICIFDIHIGKLAHGDETGHGNYDATIAADLARQAVDDLLAQSRLYRLDKIILPIGNDLLHADNLVATTTAGTRQDMDSRYHLMFRRARSLMSWVIERCAQRAPVEVVVVPGNHDAVSAWTIGQVLAAEYASDSRVTFDDSPKRRKYVRYGRNLIAFTHGNAEPLAKLPAIMAVERKEDWAATDYREWHVGHRHHQKKIPPILVDDKEGVTVRICRSLSAPDSWHAEHGWVGSQRGAEAFLWRSSGGLRSHFYHCVGSTEAAA